MGDPLVYVILGAATSGRREILADILSSLPPEEKAVVYHSEEEPVSAPETTLAAEISFTPWAWNEETGRFRTDDWTGEPKRIFFLTEGTRDPIDQVEAFQGWVTHRSGELARVLTVVHCRLLHENPKLFPWYEACIHFSDYVLLNRREEVPEKWMREFQMKFKKSFFPCHFERVKKGRLQNPALVLEPESRRVSHYFEDEEEFPLADLDEEVFEEGEVTAEELEGMPRKDPYIKRYPSGRRIKELPDISEFL